jgi:arginyl-tRNA--protein-N-Asp/Glu arginylyltransferase
MLQLTKVVDESSVCPYLDERTARMPLEVPHSHVDGPQLDYLLNLGYRRSGWFYYRTACPGCQACEPLRVDALQFNPSRSLRRVLKRGNDQLRVDIGKPQCDPVRLQLFNQHRIERRMSRGEAPASAEDYTAFLVSSWNDTQEICYWLGDRLAAVAIVDVGRASLSAVYCYFDPELDYLSLGTYSILTQIRLAQANDMHWVYLGMYVGANSHLRYKARYFPHERFQAGSWRRYEIEAEQV